MTTSVSMAVSRVLRPAPSGATADIATYHVPNAVSATHAENMVTLLPRLIDILNRRQLNVLFQPIVGLNKAEIIGYEGLIRGPSDNPLHSPPNLFKVANANGLSAQLEKLCCHIVSKRFVELNLPGKLFLNISPESLLRYDVQPDDVLAGIVDNGLDPERVIIELTENQPTYDYDLLQEAVMFYRSRGFQIAIDDLGEGFSSLRLWLELRPEFVKIDMHFIQGINQDPVKLQFVRSIHEIAKECGSLTIAEGIENPTELLMVRDIGISLGQGYHIARPHSNPASMLPAELVKSINQDSIDFYPRKSAIERSLVTVAKLLSRIEPAHPRMTNNEVYDLFLRNPELQVVPVVDEERPVGLITRSHFIAHFARLYSHELSGRKPCTALMDRRPLIIDKNTRLQDLSRVIVEADRHHLSNGFIITGNGRYLSMGTSQDLMRELTQMQINAARYANPLTLLPGNVPISEHIERLLQHNESFTVCYVDLNHFKPFNDVYGYLKGDNVIQMTGQLLIRHCDPHRDFIGHIGGDDFITVFQSDDWELRCNGIMNEFTHLIRGHCSEEVLTHGGYVSEDRMGRQIFHSLVSLSIGAVTVEAGRFSSHHQIAAAAAEVKKEAKKMAGNSLFIERRMRRDAGMARKTTIASTQ
jgi:diguanylate cyclase (GGDEF)-like protein